MNRPDADSKAPRREILRAETPTTNPVGLCVADIAALRGLGGEIRGIAKGDHIGLRAVDPEFAVVVLNGLLFRYFQTRKGSRQVVALYFPGDWASVEAFLGTPLKGEIAALTRAKVRLIPRGEIRQLLNRAPRILRLLMIETLFQTGVQSAWLTRNSIMPAIASLAHFLCEVITRSGAASSDGAVLCPFPFTQQMIAEMLGLTTVHVNRTLRVLRERRLADVTHAMLRVENIPALAAVAEFDPHYLQLRSAWPSDIADTRIY